MTTVFFFLHIFTGSVGRRILLVVPVDTLYRTSIISSSTVLPLNLFVNLSLAPLSLFLTYGPDLGVWPDCWVSAEFLCAPIPRRGSASTTTSTSQKSVTQNYISGRNLKSICNRKKITLLKSIERKTVYSSSEFKAIQSLAHWQMDLHIVRYTDLS